MCVGSRRALVRSSTIDSSGPVLELLPKAHLSVDCIGIVAIAFRTDVGSQTRSVQIDGRDLPIVASCIDAWHWSLRGSGWRSSVNCVHEENMAHMDSVGSRRFTARARTPATLAIQNQDTSHCDSFGRQVQSPSAPALVPSSNKRV